LFLARRRDRPNESQVSPRALYYDRNPIARMIYYRANGVAPHAATQRASYTVPTGKKALVVGASAMMMRATAATSLGRVHSFGGTASSIAFDCYHKNNTVDSMVTVQNPIQYPFFEGVQLSLATEDLSTGGTMDYDISTTFTEFDA